MSALVKEISSGGFVSLLNTSVNKQFDLPSLVNRLNDIDARIQTWKNICSKEKIDISEEEQALRNLKLTVGGLRSNIEGVSDHCVQVINLLEKEERICQTIVQKVQRCLRRDPLQEKLDALDVELKKVTSEMTTPWIRTALDEGVDIKDEWEVMYQATISSMETLYNTTVNRLNVKELIQRRLLKVRTHCTSRIIIKIFEHRIRTHAESKINQDPFNDNKFEFISTLSNEALINLSATGRLSEIVERCQHLFEIFQANIELYETNPIKYHDLADREWLRRYICFYREKLSRIAEDKGNPHLAKEIRNTADLALKILNTTINIKDFRKQFNETFDRYAERLCIGSSACGDNYRKKEPYNKDKHFGL